ncbi:class I adenylate-forming enzyme family protein [Actinoplanes sp. L3-i22]|uniref:class I adenylate-forming enzyme family protein n=1 Tax=Actinoplanes sp. L3-i22 TaxID=2836373 RepID=UPI001C78BDCF|nr:fatty acid--CoA ligase family protein [Actinoplanes sp. L3-i22]BCY08844.1 AMP-dependent synthetase [Actinoplanes sp. L3-i22]
MNDSFLDRLKRFDAADAVVFDQPASYTELLDAVRNWREFLSAHGVRAGDVVTLEGSSSLHTCAGMLALIDLDTVVVPLTSLPAAKRAEFLDVAQAEVTITVDTTGERVLQRTGRRADHEWYRRLRQAGRPGLVLFSSGTTGRSKASVLDFGKVLARYGEPRRAQRILSFLNLDHIGGINTLFHTLSQGGAVVTVAQRTPDSIFAAIAAQRVEVLPTTPTFLNMVLISGALERYDTSSLRLITYGTEPMPLPTLQRLRAALPQVRLKQTYGLSEVGIVPTRSRDDGTLWVKLGASAGFAYKIVDDILWVKSDMAMLGYLNAPAPFDDEGYFNTQDVVEVDGEYVHILGRRSEIINVGGEKVYPTEVENVLLEVPNVADATVSGQPSPVTGMVVKAVLRLAEPEDPQAVRARVRAHCRSRLERFKVPQLIEVSGADQHSERFKKIRVAR